jgi:hypothetical protein
MNDDAGDEEEEDEDDEEEEAEEEPADTEYDENGNPIESVNEEGLKETRSFIVSS